MNEPNSDISHNLTDIELLRVYNNVASKLVDLKDDELIFIGDNPNREFWSDERDEEYDEILDEIEVYTSKFQQLNRIIKERLK